MWPFPSQQLGRVSNYRYIINHINHDELNLARTNYISTSSHARSHISHFSSWDHHITTLPWSQARFSRPAAPLRQCSPWALQHCRARGSRPPPPRRRRRAQSRRGNWRECWWPIAQVGSYQAEVSYSYRKSIYDELKKQWFNRGHLQVMFFFEMVFQFIRDKPASSWGSPRGNLQMWQAEDIGQVDITTKVLVFGLETPGVCLILGSKKIWKQIRAYPQQSRNHTDKSILGCWIEPSIGFQSHGQLLLYHYKRMWRPTTTFPEKQTRYLHV